MRARLNKVKLYSLCTFFCITIVFDFKGITVFPREVESNAYAFCFGGEVDGTNKVYHGLVKDSTTFQRKSVTDNSCHFLSHKIPIPEVSSRSLVIQV